MDGNSLTLHAPKPGFLTFGELVDRTVQLLKEIIPIELPLQVVGNKAIFQAVIVEGLPGDTGRMQIRNLFDQAWSRRSRNLLVMRFRSNVSRPAQAEHLRSELRQAQRLRFGLLLTFGNLNRPDQPRAILVVAGIMLL